MEVEVKFHVGGLRELEQRALRGGARLERARTFETNLRFDTADGSLRRARRALRLRRDICNTLTYKQPGTENHGISSRVEHEVQVDDYDAARRFLEGLGYMVVFEYEKFRTIYSVGEVEIMLDELPYGDFVELEGAAALLEPTATMLHLRWNAAVGDSYHTLFEKMQEAGGLPFRDLTFRNFEGVLARVGDILIPQADS